MRNWLRLVFRGAPALCTLTVLLVATTGSPPLADDSATAAAVGRTSILFDTALLRGLGVEVIGAIPRAEPARAGALAFAIQAGARLSYAGAYPNNAGFSSGSLTHSGGLTLAFDDLQLSLQGFELRAAEEPYIFDLYDSEGQRWFRLGSAHTGSSADGSELRLLNCDMLLSPEFAAALGRPDLAETFVGTADIAFQAELAQRDPISELSASSIQAGVSCDPPNPALEIDVELSGLLALSQLGAREPGGRVAMAPAADLTNVGIGSVAWGQAILPDSAEPLGDPALIGEHPYLSLHFFRLADGRMRQIGQSDIKHAFYAVNSGCTCPGGQVLYPACSDRYGAGNNSDRLHFAPRSEVTVSTGQWTRVGSHFDNFGAPLNEQNDDFRSHQRADHDAFEHLLVVQEPDLQTPGAQYFIESWYVVRNDVDIMNSMGNRRVAPVLTNETWGFTFETELRQGSILDQFVDPNFPPNGAASTLVESAEGSFQLAVKTTTEGESFHYEFALMNFDFDRQLSSFSLPLAANVVVSNAEFNDIDTNAGNDWTVTITPGVSITWTAPVGNSLDWGTLFNFAFDANAPPVATSATLTALEAGSPLAVVASLAPDPLGIPGGNDSCLSPQLVGTGTSLGTLAGATRDGSSLSDGFDDQPDVWFQFVPTKTGEVRMNTCGSSDSPAVDQGLDSVLSLHSGCSPGNEIISSDDWELGNDDTACAQNDPLSGLPLDQGFTRDSAFSVMLTQGVPALVRLSRFDDGPDPFRLTILEPPPNDDQVNSTLHPGGTLAGSLHQAEPDFPDIDTEPDVWYRFVPTSTGSVRINTCGTRVATGQDTAITLYDFATGNFLDFNDDYESGNDATACDGAGGSTFDSAIAFDVTILSPLLIQVSRFDASSNGGFQLNIDGNPPFHVEITNFHFDPETGEHDLVWYGFQAGACTASGSPEFTGPRFTSDFQSVNPSTTTQYTMVCTQAGAPQNATQASTTIERPANNSCSTPTLVSQAGFPFTDSLDTRAATPDSSDPDIRACGASSGPDLATVWYSYTPNSSGRVEVDSLLSRYDTVLSVWNAAPGCGMLDSAPPVVCNDDAGVVQSQLAFDAQAGNTYLIQVGSFGDFDFPEDVGGNLVLRVPEPGAGIMVLTAFSVLAALRRVRKRV